jgi:GT2 family glycosyltransferase
MDFSVVIPTYNRIGMLEKVLEAFESQNEAPSFEVLVIDDGSHDDTAARLGEAGRRYRFPFRFHSQANAGPGRARNRGVEMAAGQIILFVGDDTVPEERFVAEHARVHSLHAQDRYAACLGYTGWPAEGHVTPFMEYINDYGLQFGYKLIRDGQIVPFNFFYTSNISIQRELLLEEKFDTSFPAAAWEDIELAYRLAHKGLKIHYNARAVTRHFHQMSVDSFARRQYTVGKSGAIFFAKHPELRHFLGVQELAERGVSGAAELARLRMLARLGESVRLFARPGVFERLMRQHYLRGLRDGLREVGQIE